MDVKNPDIFEDDSRPVSLTEPLDVTNEPEWIREAIAARQAKRDAEQDA